MKRRIRYLAFAGALALLLSGCSLDVESLLHPPKVGGEQRAVQAALETYLQDRGGALYTLEYPVEGAHTAAFLLCDAAGFPVAEGQAPALALAFYSVSAVPDETRINLLRRDEAGWVSVADDAGFGVDIREVAFGDLDGDGRAELVTGWTTYYNSLYQLAVYRVGEGLSPVSDSQPYTSLYVGDLTATGAESLLVLRVDGLTVSAALQQLQDGALAPVDTVRLDGSIQQFGAMTLCRLAPGVHGLYVDGLKSNGDTVTELIYYDQTGLNAPFYDAETNLTELTTRAGRLRAQDVDGDALVEVPTLLPLPGHTVTEIGGAVTLWRVWDYATKTWRDHSYTLTNTADGYLVSLNGDTHTHLDTAYQASTHTLTLTDTTAGRDWLWLTVGEEPPPAPAEGLQMLFLFSLSDDTAGCYAWFDASVTDAEKVRYTVTPLMREGG